MDMKDPAIMAQNEVGYTVGTIYYLDSEGIQPPENPYDWIIQNLPEGSVTGEELARLYELAEAFDYGLELAEGS